MEIKASGVAGTMESSDIFIMVEPKSAGGIEIELKSSVEKQFGRQIMQVITETLKELGVNHAIIRVNDKGALDCVIRARVQSAVHRAANSNEYTW